MATKSTDEVRRLARNEVITARRMGAVGWTRSEIRSLQRRELLFPAFAGVFFLSAHPSRLSVWTAAVARCGDGARLSHFSAAALWQLVKRDSGWPLVTVPRGAIKDVKGIRVRQTRRGMGDTERRLIPVTTLNRTLDDCAMTLRPDAIKAMLRQAEYHHDIDLPKVNEEARSRKLKEVLKLYIPGQGKTDSELEAAFYELASRAGLPTPLLQCHIPGGRADFLFPTLKLIVEVDGFDAHKGRIAFRDDRTRDRLNRRNGYDTLRFTWEDVTHTPDAVIDDLQACRVSTLAAGR